MTSTVIDAGDDLPLTIPALLRKHAKERPDQVLIVCDGVRLTFGEAEARSRRLARGLIAAGATKGSHVGILHPNGADFVLAALAATRIGAVAAPFSTLSTPHELRWLLTNADIGFLFAAPGFRSHKYDEELREAIPELDFAKPPPLTSTTAPWLRRVFFSGPTPAGRDPGWSVNALDALAEEVDDARLEAIENRVTPADRFVIIHTSGSTSTPKGVIHTQGGLIRHVANINDVRGLTGDDTLFSSAPWFWVAGFAFSMLGSMLAGARNVFSNSLSNSEFLDVLEQERVTYVCGYAASVARLGDDPSYAGRDFSCITRGNLYPIMPLHMRPKDPALRHDIYGMTEAGSALTMSGDYGDLPEHRRGAAGQFLPGYEYKIMDPETKDERPTGEVGELWIRGPFLMEGYYGRLRSQVFEPDGWWRSGDLGKVDPEGFFYLTGRLGDMIKTAGANVAPKEVEQVLRDLSGRDNIVVGVPDPKRGQAVVGVVIAETDEGFDEVALREEAARRLSSYKVPRRILRLALAEIPTVSSGKMDLAALKKLVASRI